MIAYGGANLYPKQRAAIFDPARIVTIEASAKSGKTQGCLAWLLEEAIRNGKEGRSFWWCAPVFAQAEIGFRRLAQKLPNGMYKQNKSTLTLTLVNGARIVFKSSDRPDDLFGEDVYAAVLDEASRMREESWHAIRSTLTATRGPARIIGNVRGRKNWFYRLSRLAESGAEGMAYHRITAYEAVEAGILDKDEIESARRDFARLGQESVFRQLYLAEAADDSDNPFGFAAIESCLIPGTVAAANADGEVRWTQPGRPLAAGVDLAGRGAINLNQAGDPTSRDWTAILMLDRAGQTVHLERFRKGHSDTTEILAGQLKGVMALIDSTGTGDAIVETLQRRGDMRVQGYVFNERSRQDLLEGLGLAIGEGQVAFPDGPLREELESFELRYGRRGVRWAVPESAHDDLVFALALAVKRMPWRRRGRQLTPTGVPQAGGSRWSSQGGESDAWRRYQEGLKPTTVGLADEDPDRIPPVPVAVPPLIEGPGAGRWR